MMNELTNEAVIILCGNCLLLEIDAACVGRQLWKQLGQALLTKHIHL